MVVKTVNEKVENKAISTLYVRCENQKDWDPVLASFNKLMQQLDSANFKPILIVPFMQSKQVVTEQGPMQELIAVKLDIIPMAMADGVYEHSVKDVIGTLTGNITSGNVIVTEVKTSSDVTMQVFMNDSPAEEAGSEEPTDGKE